MGYSKEVKQIVDSHWDKSEFYKLAHNKALKTKIINATTFLDKHYKNIQLRSRVYCINKWIRGLGFPESLHQIYELQQDNNKYTSINSQMNIFSDGTLQVLNSNEKPTIQVKYYDLFPFALTSLVFDATISKPDPFVATVKFHYTYFDLLDKNGNPL